MKRYLTVPGYIYSAAKDSEHLEFFVRQYLKHVDRYDDTIAESLERKEMGRRIGYAFFSALRHNHEQFCAMDEKPSLISLGDKGFDWKFIEGSLTPDSVVYGAGLGTNISFEQQLTEAVGCMVHCFDPTPQAAEYTIPLARANPKLAFHAVGLFAVDDVLKFYKPPEPGLGSLSATNITYSEISINAPVKRLSSVMRDLGHDHIDLLKIDIEGSEHGVIEDMLFMDLDVRQLCVEFDMPTPPWRVEATLRRLMLADYELLEIWGLNAVFAKKSLLRDMGYQV